MKRDTIKTLAGLVIIGIIVVATFLYGNAQRQAQLRHDQDVKNQQAQAGDQAKKAQPSTSAAPAGTPAKTQAPVQSPAANSLQGSGATSTPKPSGGQVAGAQTPTTGGTNTTPVAGTPLPQTGSPMEGLVGVSAIGFMIWALRRSKRAIVLSARSNR